MKCVLKGHFGTCHDGYTHADPSIHAEVDALNKIINWKHRPKKLDLFVIRVSKTGILGESKPCFHCVQKLIRSGIQIVNVYYSTRDKLIVCEKFVDMADNNNMAQMSSGYATRQKKNKK